MTFDREYTHVLSSPETFTGRRVSGILRDPTFRSSVKWVVLDEVHLAYIWGRRFRKSYSLLRKMRYALGTKPWFGWTATLDNDTFQNLCQYAGSSKRTVIKRFSINRPEIAIIRAIVKGTEKPSLKHLRFVVADAARRHDGFRMTEELTLNQLKELEFQLEPPDSE